MLIWVFRTIFVIVVLGVLLFGVTNQEIARPANSLSFRAVLYGGLGMAVFVFLLDVLTPKKKLKALAGVFFGLLVGLLISGALAPVIDLIADSYKINMIPEARAAIKWLCGICVCFLVISIVMRTKDDVRFVIPYIEFAKQTKGARPLVLDTSAIIDGRIADLCQTKLFDAPIMVPRFVLNELQLVADSSDRLKRNRGRRGLDILKKMQESTVIDIQIEDVSLAEFEETKGVDQKLVVLAKHCNGRIATTDYNLTKVAQVREVDVVNVNDLANSLKVVVLPGEGMEVRIIRPGEEADQGIGYLPDGTMVVVENARDKIGRDVVLTVTSSLQTSAGKMIFGKFDSFKHQKPEDNRRYPNRRQNRVNSTVGH
jgi:uncharacterized protein YacL